MIQPLNNYVLVKLLELESKSSIAGFEIIEKEKKKTFFGEVIAFGDGEATAKYNLKKGDTIIFQKYGGEDYEIDGIKHKILGTLNILAKYV